MEHEALLSVRFRKEREETWRELEGILKRVSRRGIRSLSPAELHRLPSLYRSVLSALSVARAISLDSSVVDYLNALSQRAYFVVYGPKSTIQDAIRVFLGRTFPGMVWKIKWHVVLAATFLIVGHVTGFYMTRANPDRFFTFVAEEMAQGRTPSASREDLIIGLFQNEDSDAEEDLAGFSGFLFANNSNVGILCFAVCFVPVVLVFMLLFMNGTGLGAMTEVFHAKGLAIEWWSWLLPHGITELLAIILCGGAALLVSFAILFPGNESRTDALARRGREGGLVVMGAVLMLVLAALLEGFFRQLVDDMGIRYGVASLSGAFWIAYFCILGRKVRV